MVADVCVHGHVTFRQEQRNYRIFWDWECNDCHETRVDVPPPRPIGRYDCP